MSPITRRCHMYNNMSVFKNFLCLRASALSTYSFISTYVCLYDSVSNLSSKYSIDVINSVVSMESDDKKIYHKLMKISYGFWSLKKAIAWCSYANLLNSLSTFFCLFMRFTCSPLKTCCRFEPIRRKGI